jgi:hypothetical protein
VRDVVPSRWCEPSGLVGAIVTGAVTRADQAELLTFVKGAIARFGEVRILIRLERYAGGHHDGRFDPDELWNGGEGEGICRIAVVGEPAWKTVAPITSRHRRVPIRYFATECAARGWLAGQTRRDGRCPLGPRAKGCFFHR